MATTRHRRGARAGGARFTMEDIHRALFASKTPNNENPSASASGPNPFNEALHRYSLFPRPKEQEDLANLVELVGSLAGLCGASPDHWKVFLLLAFQRRYHAKAPAADSRPGDTEETTSVGDGERLVFYVTCLALERIANRHHRSDGLHKETAILKNARAAARCMVEVAPGIGGTRDINAMIEHLCFSSLAGAGLLSTDRPDKPSDAEAFHASLLSSLDALLPKKDGGEDDCFGHALSKAASLLDADLAKCAKQAGQVVAVPRDELMSTVHVTLPHRDRGNKEGSAWQRNLANRVAEILVWRKTKAAGTEDRFSRALDELLAMPLSAGTKRSAPDVGSRAHDCMLQMQTTARKKRKILNDRARDHGSLLCSRYLMDRTSLTFRQVRRGKAGDLARLRSLASKFKDARVLKMIASKNTDPTKADCIDSLGSLIGSWRDVRAAVDDGSVEELELQIQAQTVRATIEQLRAKAGEGEEGRTVLVAQLGRGKKDSVCAILSAAALHPRGRLLLGGKERDVSKEEAVMELLNEAILESVDPPRDWDIKDILKRDFQDVIVLSSVDVELDEGALQDLQNAGRTIRVHSTSRVENVESVTVELRSDINEKLKSGAPVSVAVLLDCTYSMSSEIEGCKKGAMKTIELFNDLAPVRWANFLGYWDPVNSAGDPDPRSSGYLDPRDSGSLEKIQNFVDKRLPCKGGGDEPEDIPAALEKLLADVKAAGLSADNGVHFVFFVADAGYRPNEDRRVTSLLTELAGLGIVMVMCPVRSSGSCRTLEAKNKEVFFPGQYIKLGGVSQLESIATTVTESIRASLFKSGNVASVTASIGETMESIGQLCSFQKDHATLKHTEELAKPPPEPSDGEGEAAAEDDEMPLEEEEVVVEEVDEEKMSEGSSEEEDTVAGAADTGEAAPAVFAPSNDFRLTNIDRIYLSISRLPEMCHRAVEDAFGGGKSLQEVVAVDVARRLTKEGIPVRKLRESGYPPSLVELVRTIMGGHGVKRVEVGM